MEIIKQAHKKVTSSNPTYQFNVVPRLLKLAKIGDAQAQFQIGLQALNEGRFGFAKLFLNFAYQGGYKQAKSYLEMISRELHRNELSTQEIDKN